MKNTFFLPGIISLVLLLSCGTNTEGPANIRFSKDGMPVINGERTFIIGSYYMPSSHSPFATLNEAGYNYIRLTADKTLMDSAYKYGLYTWLNTGSLNQNNDTGKINSLLREFSSHPSLFAWEIEDEPAYTWMSAEARISAKQMKESYRLIKKSDKKHPVYTNHGPVNLVSTLKKYNKSTDIIACDVYPVIPHGIKPSYALFPDGLQGDLLNTEISQIGEYADKMMDVTGRRKPLFMVLQAFAWEMLKNEEIRDSSMILYPSYKQSRFMAWNAIVHGATGILYWGSKYGTDSLFTNDLALVTRELSSLQELISSRSTKDRVGIKYHELGYSTDAGIEFITKKIRNKLYLICVNSDRTPAKVNFSRLYGYRNVKVLNENRSVEMNKFSFTDSFEAFDVHIYELYRKDNKLK